MPSRRGDLVLALATGIIVLGLQLPLARLGVSLLDEGAILQIAADMQEGLRPYCDAVYPGLPGILHVTAVAFAIGGVSVGCARVLAAALFALSAMAVFVIARWRLGRLAALGVVALFVVYRVWAYPAWQFLDYSTLAVTLVLVATAVLGEAFARPRSWMFLVAGACGGLAFVTRQDAGFVGPAALGLALLVRRVQRGREARGEIPRYMLGGLAVVAAVAAVVAIDGCIPDLVRQAIVTPLYIWRNVAYPGRPALWPFLAQDTALRGNPSVYLPPVLFDLHWPALSQSAVWRESSGVDVVAKLLYHLPWLLVVVAALGLLVRLLRRRVASATGLQRDLLLVFLAAAFVPVFNRPHDWVHLMVLYPPTLLLAARVVTGHWLVNALALLVLAALAGLSAALALQLAARHDAPIRTARGTLWATEPQARTLQELLDALAARGPANAPLAALPYHPLVNFLADRPRLTRWYALWPVDPEPVAREREVMDALRLHPETTVVYSPTQVPHFPRLPVYAPALFQALVDRYTIAQVFGGGLGEFTFLLLGDRPPATGVSLLGPRLAEARVALEPAGGERREAVGAERTALAGEAAWPVVPALRIAALPGTSVTVVYRVRVEPGQRLQTRVGINPDHWADFPPVTARFAVAVRRAGGEEQELAGRTLDPFRQAADRQWIDIVADLAPWRGETVELVLRVAAPPGAARRDDAAGFGDPRLISVERSRPAAP